MHSLKNRKVKWSGEPERPRIYGLLVLTTLFWAGNTVASKFAVGEISPMLLVSLRWGFTAILIAAFCRHALIRDWSTLRPRIPFLLLLGMLGFTTFNALFYVAAHTTTALNMSIMQGAIPAVVLLGAYWFQGTEVRLRQLGGLAITFAGVIWIVTAGDLTHLITASMNIGDLFMLIACFCYAGYTVALRNKPNVAIMSLFAAFSTAAFFSSLPLTLIEGWLGLLRFPTAKGWLVVGYVVIFPSLLAQLFWIRGVAQIGPGRTSVFINLIPVFSVILSVYFLGEDFELHHLSGIILVLGGIWLAEHL